MPGDIPFIQQTLLLGEIQLKGQFMLGSNHTFLVDIHYQGANCQAVYKPDKGEQPLWDFEENTLALREVAAYLVSQALGFDIVPVTVRRDGPFGPGSFQQYIEYDSHYHYFNFSAEDKILLKPIVLFDLLCNNADRKGSHVFFDAAHKLYAIDHGLCFHEEDKLRTVIWDFAGQAIPDELLLPLSSFLSSSPSDTSLPAELVNYLNPRELTALRSRAKALLTKRVFLLPPADRRAFPYPPL